MSWRWVPDREPDASGPKGATPSDPRTSEPIRLTRSFPTQGEAETWLGEFYPELIAAGVGAVSLYEADRLVYGPMNLELDH